MKSTESLLAAARAACTRAYAPYSGFAVGAALLTDEGIVFTGSNIENASFGLTVCAERTAVWSAVHAGYRKFSRIAVAADCSPPPAPCGACRQVLWELAGDIEVVMGNPAGDIVERRLADLLPQAFSGADLTRKGDLSGTPASEQWRLPPTLNPVGYVVCDYDQTGGIPQNYRELLSQIVIDPDLKEGLHRLEEERRMIVIGYLHRARGYALKEERSGRGGEVYGIFACRAPLRPNALSHTEVELVEIKKNTLTVRGLDLFNNTPVLDLKTVLFQPDSKTGSF
ncbi:MAG: cytidine deaminase [Bacillota bacterium]